MRWAVVALTVSALVAPALGQDPARVTARPDQRLQLDFQHYYTVGDIDVALNSLAGAYPEYLRLESLGRSPGGHELWVMSATRQTGTDAALKPALFIGAGLGLDDLPGTEMALFTLFELVQNHDRDPVVERVLEDTVIYVAPCLDPDLRARVFADEGSEPAAEREPAAVLDANFEIGWRPAGRRSGPYPLSQPEARSAAAFLLAHPNVALVQTYASAAPAGEPAGLPLIPEVDTALHEQLVEAARDARRGERVLHGLPGLRKDGGSLLEFGYGHRGAFALVTVVARGDDEPGLPEVFELFPLGRRAYQSTLRLARALPRLVLPAPEVTRLKGELWQIDVAVSNAGTLPTLSALGQERFACGSPRLTLTGAELVAAAVRQSSADPFQVVTADAGTLTLDQIAGGSSSAVRMVVTATPGTTVELHLVSPRAGGETATVELN